MDFSRDGDAPFNMAVATLMRLDKILQHFTTIELNFPSDSAEKQKIKLNLTKQFLLNSTTLLSMNEVKKFRERINNIFIQKKFVVKGGIQKHIYVYDEKLEKELDEILEEIQDCSRKYYMPKGKDLSSAVAF